MTDTIIPKDEEEPEVMVCYNHPNRATLLRCNKCGRPICLDCAVSTPTGYRCKECIKAQQQRFNTSLNQDYLIGGAIACGLGLAGSLLRSVIGIFPFLLSIILGGVFGVLIVNVVRWATKKRRSQTLNRVVVCAAGLGAILPTLNTAINVLRALFLGRFDILLSASGIFGLNVLFIISLCASVWANLKGMTFRKY